MIGKSHQMSRKYAIKQTASNLFIQLGFIVLSFDFKKDKYIYILIN